MDNDAELKITHVLEMSSPDEFTPASAASANLDVRRVEIPCPEFNWFLYEAVGADYHWGGREGWKLQHWLAYVARPELETWVAYVSGTPAGYYELEKERDGSIRIECFGLLRQFYGKGLGGQLLNAAVERCWAAGANRIWLQTCSHDHPNALLNYQARGFKVVKEIAGACNPERRSVLFTQRYAD